MDTFYIYTNCSNCLLCKTNRFETLLLFSIALNIVNNILIILWMKFMRTKKAFNLLNMSMLTAIVSFCRDGKLLSTLFSLLQPLNQP